MAWDNTHSANFVAASTQNLDVANAGVYDLAVGSFSCWFRLTTKPTGGNAFTLMSTNEASHGVALNVEDQGSSVSKIRVAINGGGGHNFLGTTSLSIGVWYHVTFAWNTTSAEIILNGISEATISDSATVAASSNPLSIGKENVGGGRFYMNGDIDDVRVYNTKRTTTQVLADYTQELIGTETGLLSYWKLNNALTDTTSGARTLTDHGSVTFTTVIPFVANSISEVLGTLLESFSIETGWDIAVGDVLGVPVETLDVRAGIKEQVKSASPTWREQNKS